MFIPEDQSYKLIGSYTNEKFQILSIMVYDNLQLFVVYLSTRECPYGNVVSEISKMLQRKCKPIIIGDFNFHTNKTNALTTYFEQIGLKQIVHEPTHTKGNNTTFFLTLSTFCGMYQMHVCHLSYNQKHTCAITYLVKKDPCITSKVHSHSKLPVPEVESIDQIRRDIKEAKSNL